jgi:hypothetical protein
MRHNAVSVRVCTLLLQIPFAVVSADVPLEYEQAAVAAVLYES